jgi:hypothetical protein
MQMIEIDHKLIRPKHAICRPKYFDDQIDQILFLLQKSGNLGPKQTKKRL